MKTKDARVVDLSQSTTAVLAFHPSGRVLSATFVRGREAFTLSESEAKRLSEALVVRGTEPE